MFKSYKPKQPQLPPELLKEKPEPVKMKIGGISRQGVVNIKFNQKLIVPSFLDNSPMNTEKRGPRELVALSELNVARDVLYFKFIVNSDINADTLKYYLEITKWEEEEMDV